MNRRSELVENGVDLAQPWCRTREELETGGEKVLVRPLGDSEIWREALKVEDEARWQTYWNHAAEKWGHGSQWDPAYARGEVATSYADGTDGVEDYFLYPRDHPVSLESVQPTVDQVLEDQGMGQKIQIGVLATLAPPGNLRARPGLTLVCSSPAGGAVAGMMIMTCLEGMGISGLIARSIRNNQAAVLKAIFLPEWWIHYRDNNNGIDWSLWEESTWADVGSQIHAAALVWCDEMVKRLRVLKQDTPLMIDEVYFEWYRACPLVETDPEESRNLLESFIRNPPSLEDQVRAYLERNESETLNVQ